MAPTRPRLTALGLAFLTAALAATAPLRAAGAEALSFGLNWLPQGEHCGFYQALATGRYAAAGLEVELRPGGPEVNLPLLVASGKVDLGMGSSFVTLNMVGQGIDAVTIAAMLQRSPQTLVAHPDQGIARLADMRGKPIMVADFSRQEFWQFLRARHGFEDTQLRKYTYNAGPFLADPTAIQQGYVTEDAFFLGQALGRPPVSVLLADEGYSDYATTVYGLRRTVEARRPAVQAFIDASILGYAECLDGDPAPAKAAILAANPDHTAELFDFKLAQMDKYALLTGGDAAQFGIGAMTEARWQSFFTVMADAGVYPPTLSWRQAFDLGFVNRKVGIPAVR